MNQISLQFLQQPSNGDSFSYDLEFLSPTLLISYSATFVNTVPGSGEIEIGADINETIINVRNYFQLNNPLPGLVYNIFENYLIITKATRNFNVDSFSGIEDVLVISEEIPDIPIKKIFVRSPYFIEIDRPSQTSAKIEVFLWNKGTTEPTTPKYILTKNIVSPSQTLIAWNVSNFAKEFIKPIAPVSVNVPTEEDVNCWCYMKVKRYSNDELLSIETFVCLNGYTLYSNGYNNYTDDTIVPLLNTDIKLYTNTGFNYINAWIETPEDYVWEGNDEFLFTTTEAGLWKLPYDYNSYTLGVGEDVEFTINSEQLCEPKYTPLTCSFTNRYGGWQYITFFKASNSSIDVTSKDYNLLPNSINYNVLQGQKQRFNFQGKQKIKCNTGWVDENYFELIQDLLLSEVVLLDNKPVIVKSQSSDIKTHLKDKNINYEIEFEYNYGLINDVI